MVVEVDHPQLGRLRQLGIPFKLAATPASIRTAPPLLGEHATEILAELGYDAAEIDRLRSDGVI
jgi:crotonobetainyl-CoA:carnitine CoA-transferase CaiB-like acyl-CoA transferase